MDIRPDAGPFRLAVDLGTTSIHWRLLDGTGHEAASGQALNPQMGAGSDVVSRLAAARNQEGPGTAGASRDPLPATRCLGRGRPGGGTVHRGEYRHDLHPVE